MKHGIKKRKLNRFSSHRGLLLINLSKSLLKYEQIRTTLPKAKELKSFVEKLITLGKRGGLDNMKRAFSILHESDIVSKLFDVLSVRYKDRNGGYTRVIKHNFRRGDSAPMAIVELVDKN